jgi:hypothetical protein
MNDAQFSLCNRYRYWLRRDLVPWEVNPLKIVWLMLNPSTADCTVNDPTIKQCMAFSTLWGYHCMDVVNVYAWRATDPRALRHASDSIGPANDNWIHSTVYDATLVMCAWGAHKIPPERLATLRHILAGKTLACLGTTKSGMPWHPLYRPHHLGPTTWSFPT